MSSFKLIVCLLATLVLGACKVIATSPDEGYIHMSVSEDCPASTTCENDVANGSEFSETYTAMPNIGYRFSHWLNEDKHLCGGSSEPCALNGVPGSFTERDVILFIEPVFEPDPNFLGGTDAYEYFAANIAEPVIASRCDSCHISRGVARNSRLVYQVGNDVATIEANYTVLAGYVLGGGGRGDLLLSKASGGSGHGGGTQLAKSSSGYQALEIFVGLLEN